MRLIIVRCLTFWLLALQDVWAITADPFIAQVVMFGPMANTSNTFDETQPKYT